MEKICERKNCCGCYACLNACPKNAIYMKEDEAGYIYPAIDTKLCVGCGICEVLCKSRKNIKKNETIKCYSAFSGDNIVHSTSSSGGIAYEMMRKIIGDNGCAYGVSSFLDDDNSVSFARISEKRNIRQVQGSKYVQAYVKNTFKNVKEDLESGLKVLFIGTPCQVVGLKAFLSKEYECLITVDLVCHGVMSQKILFNDINQEFDYITFRGKDGFTIITKNNGKTNYKKNKYQSDYYYSFLNGFGYRRSCYACDYAEKDRVGDITIGDFWGKSNYKKEKGISAVLINTEKGKTFFNTINSICKNEEKIEDVYISNEQLLHPTRSHEDYNEFLNNALKYSLKYALRRKLGIKKYCIVKIKGVLKSIKDWMMI